MKCAVVTGANGFIGKAVVRELCRQNVKVCAVVRPEAQNLEELKGLQGVEFFYSDLSNYHKNLPEQLQHENPDVFFHFAWQGAAGKQRADEKIQLANVQWTCDAVRVAHQIGCKRFVFAASIMAYEVEKNVKDESAPSGSAIYSTAKLCADYMARIIANQMGMDFISGIISSIYGPGEFSERLINTSLRKFLRGEHLSFSPGDQMYDFIYIDDAARVFAALGERGKTNKNYYIGSDKPRPLKEFLLEMRDIVSPGTEIGLGELPPFDGLTYQEFDINAVWRDTGIKSEISFSEGIARTMAWLRNQKTE